MAKERRFVDGIESISYAETDRTIRAGWSD